MTIDRYAAVIVGGGPAGLNTTLYPGRNVQQAAMAAASGRPAAVTVNADLVREDRPGSLYTPAHPRVTRITGRAGGNP